MKVVIAEPIADKLDSLIINSGKQWTAYSEELKTKQELIERIKDAEVATAYSIKFDEEVLSQCPKLKYLAIPAVGAESYVDMNIARSRGITVMNCPGYNSLAVAEMAIGLALDVLRGISSRNRLMSEGNWEHNPTNGRLLSGKRVALIGYGNIGKTIQRLLNEWCPAFVVINSSSSAEDIDSALGVSDIVFICCSLNDNTRGMISKNRLPMMKKSAVLINVARGAIVDGDSLYENLLNGNLAGAALDVFSDEPQRGDAMPESVMRFTRLNNVVCTSHIAGSSLETRDILGQMIYDNIESCILGKPINTYKDR